MRSQPVDLTHTDSGSGEPVVLLMGLGADATAWKPHTDVWSASYRCIAVDNRGAGRSPAPSGPYSTKQMADDTAALIERLGFGSVAVVGISMGSAIAQELALRHPRLVSRVVLTATWSARHPYTAAVMQTLATVRDAMAPSDFTQFLQTLIWTPGWFDTHDDALAEARRTEPAVDARVLRAQVAACLSHDTQARLRDVRVPVLVTAGSVDRFIPPSLGAGVAAAVPDSVLEIFEGTGHVHHWEELDRYNQLVGEWLGR